MKSSTPMEKDSGSQNSSDPFHHTDLDLEQPASCSIELSKELKEKVNVLLVTVTAIEWNAVFRKMKPVAGASAIYTVQCDKASYMVGMFGVYCVALIQSDQGSRASQSEVTAALNCWNTKATILVGTCLGLKQDEHKLGDVIVSKPLATYDPERVISSTKSNSLGLVIEGGQNLSPLFTKEATVHKWKFGSSKRRSGLMLSGSKIVESSEFSDKLKMRYPEGVAMETEGDGVHKACYDHAQQWIVIKGICVFPGSTNENNQKVEKFAAAAATSLVLHVLSEDNLKSIGCVAICDGEANLDAWTPKGFPVFISYDPGLYRKQPRIINGLLDTLENNRIQSQVSTSSDRPKPFTTAKVDCAVFVALIDHECYLQSLHCMKELRIALDSSSVKVLPILLSRVSEYPFTTKGIEILLGSFWKLEWSSSWTSQEYLRIVRQVESLAVSLNRRVYEDPSFGVSAVVNDVRNFLKHLGVQDILQQKEAYCTPSIWRMLNPIKECSAFGGNESIVDIHQADFNKIVEILTNSEDNTSVSIAGLKAAGGVGKTFLARRIATCHTIGQCFASEGVLWAEFGELDSTAQPALERIYRDLGGEEELCFDEDVMGQLAKATTSFKKLLKMRQPTALLVLDDLWKKKYLELFKKVVRGTNVKILVTTRFKGMVEEVFGPENSVIDLNTFLSHEDAMKMMNMYAGRGSVQKQDVPTMSKLAGHFGYHAKALAIVSARFKRFKSWENLLSSVEKSRLKLNGAVEAKEWVFAAVKHTLDFALKDDSDLIKFFLQLGVLVEGARFSISDLCVLWKCQVIEASVIATSLCECSVLETDKSPEGDEDVVYYIHDLVRDCARQDTQATNDKEKEFIQQLLYIYQNEKDRVTEYTLKYLPQHLSADRILSSRVNRVYWAAREGRFEEAWSNNSFIVLTALKNRMSALGYAGVDLCKQDGFFKRALEIRRHIRLVYFSWIKNADAFEMFANALKENCSLRSIYIYGIGIGPNGTVAMMNALKENPSCVLEHVYLYANNIKLDGAKSVAQWLEVNTSLTELNIGCNAIGDTGATAIGEAMKNNKTLKKLNLNDNCIGDIGAIALGESLERNSGLLDLSLESNKISENGVAAVGHALSINSTLMKLNLVGNRIGDDGAVTLGNALQNNSTLKWLDLENSRIGDVGKAALLPHRDIVFMFYRPSFS